MVSVRTVTTREELCYTGYKRFYKEPEEIFHKTGKRYIISSLFLRAIECWDRMAVKLLVRSARVIRARVQQDLQSIESIKERLAMRRGRRIKRGKSKRSFTRGARRVHRKNTRDRPMRGGIRL